MPLLLWIAQDYVSHVILKGVSEPALESAGE